jgi:hypothetical protein
VRYKSWESVKPSKLDKPEEALRNVVTDHYFNLMSGKRDEEEKEKAQRKAQTMSWALVYYLAQERRDGLLRYYQELSSMPRDLDFDEEISFPHDLNSLPRGYDKQKSKLSDEPNIMTSKSLLVEVSLFRSSFQMSHFQMSLFC